jgi:hypothetical protein
VRTIAIEPKVLTFFFAEKLSIFLQRLGGKMLVQARVLRGKSFFHIFNCDLLHNQDADGLFLRGLSGDSTNPNAQIVAGRVHSREAAAVESLLFLSSENLLAAVPIELSLGSSR